MKRGASIPSKCSSLFSMEMTYSSAYLEQYARSKTRKPSKSCLIFSSYAPPATPLATPYACELIWQLVNNTAPLGVLVYVSHLFIYLFMAYILLNVFVNGPIIRHNMTNRGPGPSGTGSISKVGAQIPAWSAGNFFLLCLPHFFVVPPWQGTIEVFSSLDQVYCHYCVYWLYVVHSEFLTHWVFLLLKQCYALCHARKQYNMTHWLIAHGAPRAQPFVNVGARAPVPHGVGTYARPTYLLERCRCSGEGMLSRINVPVLSRRSSQPHLSSSVRSSEYSYTVYLTSSHLNGPCPWTVALMSVRCRLIELQTTASYRQLAHRHTLLGETNSLTNNIYTWSHSLITTRPRFPMNIN